MMMVAVMIRKITLKMMMRMMMVVVVAMMIKKITPKKWKSQVRKGKRSPVSGLLPLKNVFAHQNNQTFCHKQNDNFP